MRSHRVTVRLPFPLADALRQVCAIRGFDHLHACIIGACIILVQNERRRDWVREIANAKPKDQDFLLDKLLTFPTDLKGMLRELRKLNHRL